MSNYQEQIKAFERSYNSVIEVSVIELSRQFDKMYEENDSIHILPAINKAVSMLSQNFNTPTKMQISYDIANGYHDLRIIEGNDREEYFEKEIYYYRTTLDMFESNYNNEDDESTRDAASKVAKYVAMRAYTNLGNLFRAIHRYISAIDCYQNALLLNNEFAMASLNLSLLLFNYANLQIKPHEKNYYYHACFHYYEQTKKYKLNLEKQHYLDDLQTFISQFSKTYINDFLSKPLQLPIFQIDNQEEINYRNYILIFRLFLDPCLDILSNPCFAVDSITLPFKEPLKDNEKEFVGLFNQIKQEYNLARFLWYKLSTDYPDKLYADMELDLVQTGDDADYSLQESLLRTAFKTVYSLFDRIGFFINSFFHVGLTGAKISFKNVWKEDLRDENNVVCFHVPNPIRIAHANNPLIQAMYWLQKDFFEKNAISVTSPSSEKIFQMRNDMEHNCLRTGQKAYNVTFTRYTSSSKIEANTFKLLKLARELIIYLCLAVEFNYKK